MKLSHLQFAAAVDTLRKHKQRFCDERPNNVRTAKMLSELTGQDIPVGTAAAIREASGVEWTTKLIREPDGGGERFSNYNAVGTLARAVDKLYRKLGEDVPDGVSALVEHFKAKA